MPGFVEQLAKTRTFSGQITAQELQSSLEELKQLDKLSERKKLFGCLWAVAGGGLALVGFVLAQETSPVLGGGCLFIGIGLLAWGIINRVSAGRTDFEDRRYELLERVAGLIRVDMNPEAAFNVGLDLNDVNAKNKFVRKGKAGLWNVKYYEDSWLNLGGQLADGTKFTITFTEKHQDRSRTKRSASGKIKHKSKTKSACQAVVTLKAKDKRYPHTGQLGPQARGAVQLPGGVQLKDLSAHDNVLTLKTASKSAWTVDSGTALLSQMLLSLYQVLNLSKAIDKAQS